MSKERITLAPTFPKIEKLHSLVLKVGHTQALSDLEHTHFRASRKKKLSIIAKLRPKDIYVEQIKDGMDVAMQEGLVKAWRLRGATKKFIKQVYK